MHNNNADILITRMLYAGTCGSLAMVKRNGNSVTFADGPAGTVLQIRVRRVLAATTGGALVGLA